MRFNKSKSSLLLMEILITIFLFMLCSVVCIKIFAAGYNLDEDTRELNAAVMWCESAVSVAGEADVSAAYKDIYPLGDSGVNNYTAYYNKDYSLCDKNNAAYELRCIWSTEDAGRRIDVKCIKISNESDIYGINTLIHIEEN